MERKRAQQTADTETAPRQSLASQTPLATPGLVLAFAPEGTEAADRAPYRDRLVIGRSSSASWCIRDKLLSRAHFEIVLKKGTPVVRDLGSHNGTFVNGAKLNRRLSLEEGDVIRAGSCLFVAHRDVSYQLAENDRFSEIAGPFDGPLILRDLTLAGRSGRHVLLYGETGSGKELAARMLHQVFKASGRNGPLVTHNGARFAGEEDAVAGLFGVADAGFTGVKRRKGSLEAAARGTLFLDEVHNLPLRAQRSLLRFIEDGLFQRLGASGESHIDVRLTFGTNQPVEQAVSGGILAHDLVARLHRVSLPPLRDRRGDIPDIFLAILDRRAPEDIAVSIRDTLNAEVLEALLLQDFREGNVRDLEELAALVIARLKGGDDPRLAVSIELKAVGQSDGPFQDIEVAAARLCVRYPQGRDHRDLLPGPRQPLQAGAGTARSRHRVHPPLALALPRRLGRPEDRSTPLIPKHPNASHELLLCHLRFSGFGICFIKNSRDTVAGVGDVANFPDL